jgi:hypothetical protein
LHSRAESVEAENMQAAKMKLLETIRTLTDELPA